MSKILKSKEFKTAVIGGISVLVLWAIINAIYSKIADIDYVDALISTWNILNMKLNILWFVVFILVVVFYLKWHLKKLEKKIDAKFFTKQEVVDKLKAKLDESDFDNFYNVYNYRRLKNHPYHELYTGVSDNINSFKNMVWHGNYKNDYYQIDNGIAGLIAEIKEQGWLHSSDKTDIINNLTNCYKDEYNSNKEELLQLLNEIKTI